MSMVSAGRRDRRVVILDSNVEINEGHGDHFIRHARRDLMARQLEVAAHGSARIAPSLAHELGVLPSFSRRGLDLISDDPYDGLLADLLTCADVFASEAEQCLEASARPGDLVVLPSATLRELVGLTRLAHRRPPTFRLAALFHRNGGRTFREAGPGSLTGALLRDLGRSLSIFDASGLWIGGLTEPLCASLSAALARPVRLAASPNWYAAARPAPGSPRLRIGFLGHLRLEKGCLALPQLTAALAAAVPDAVSVVAGHHARDAPDFGPLRALAAKGVDVRLVWQDEEMFADLIASCDLIVLPYDRASYGDALSGIFCHAVAHGKPVVVPEGTSMAHQIALGRATGLTFEGDGLADVTGAIRRALDLIGPLQDQAAVRARRWRREACGPALLDELLAFGFGEQSPSSAGSSSARQDQRACRLTSPTASAT